MQLLHYEAVKFYWRSYSIWSGLKDLLLIECLQYWVYIIVILESAWLSGDYMHMQVVNGLSGPCPLLYRNSSWLCLVPILQEFSEELYCQGQFKEFFRIEVSVFGFLALRAHKDVYIINNSNHLRPSSIGLWTTIANTRSRLKNRKFGLMKMWPSLIWDAIFIL